MTRRAAILGDGGPLTPVLGSLGFVTQNVPTDPDPVDMLVQGPPDLIVVGRIEPELERIVERLRLEPTLGQVPILRVGRSPTESDDSGHVGLGPFVEVPPSCAGPEIREAVARAETWAKSLRERGIDTEVHFTFPSVAADLFECCQAILGLVRSTPLRPEAVGQVRQALLELGQNAIEWGNRLDPAKRVHIVYRAGPGYIEVRMEDQGNGFDPDRLPQAASLHDPLAHLEARQRLGLRIGGFGLLMCRKMMDELRFNATGNAVTVVKRFPGPTPGDDPRWS